MQAIDDVANRFPGVRSHGKTWGFPIANMKRMQIENQIRLSDDRDQKICQIFFVRPGCRVLSEDSVEILFRESLVFLSGARVTAWNEGQSAAGQHHFARIQFADNSFDSISTAGLVTMDATQDDKMPAPL